jgi:hypothetical protein
MVILPTGLRLKKSQRSCRSIFQEDGSEICLKPASLYFDELPLEATFADMIRIAQRRDELCIGVKAKALANNKDANNGVPLIPEKNVAFTLQPEDSVAVGEDELQKRGQSHCCPT